MSTLFRSPDYGKGRTRVPGSLHFHVDVAYRPQADAELVRLAENCADLGWPAKVTRVSAARRGRHVSDPAFSADYKLHTPELAAGRETFAAYLTALLPDTAGTAEAIERQCREVRKFIGGAFSAGAEDIVAEVERVTCVISEGAAVFADPALVRLDSAPGKALFEIHHFADLETGSASFAKWTQACEERGIRVGGWFQFEKPKETAFRSLRFARQLDFFELIAEARAVQSAAATFSPGRPRTETLVEHIVDIWHV